MSLFQLEYIKDALRSKGYPVSKETTRRQACFLLGKSLKTPMKELCKELEIEYIKRPGGGLSAPLKVYLHYNDKEESRTFSSVYRLEEFLEAFLENIF